MVVVDYMLTRPSGVVSLILASPAISVPRWAADLNAYRGQLPTDVQRALDECEANGTTDSPAYQAATTEFYRRHLCRINPWPKSLRHSFRHMGTEVYGTMWGPSEFCITGNLAHYDRAGRLREVVAPTLFTCGRYDEATPEATAWYHGLVPGSEMVVFEKSAHMAHLEEPDAFLAVARDFLRRAEARA
jgi:proline iminopeptidase